MEMAAEDDMEDADEEGGSGSNFNQFKACTYSLHILHLDTEIEDCELVQPFAGFEEEMLDYFDESSDDGGGDDTETEGYHNE